MFTDPNLGAAASTASAAATQAQSAATDTSHHAATNLPPDVVANVVNSAVSANHEQVRHLLLGSPNAVQATIHQLHQRGYADPNDWSRILPTGRPNEVMAILTKRMGLSSH